MYDKEIRHATGQLCRFTVKELGRDRRIGQCYDSPISPSTYKRKPLN